MATRRIVCDPKILSGEPVVEGTGVIVVLVLGKLDTGEIAEDIVEALIQRRAAPLRRQLRLEGVLPAQVGIVRYGSSTAGSSSLAQPL